MDSSLVIPDEYQLSTTRYLLAFHISTNKDFLLSNTELWLKLFGLIELVFQLPLFVLNVLNRLPHKNIWNLIYSVNVSLTTSVCLVYICCQYEAYGLNVLEAAKLFVIYVPYLVISLVMFVDCFNRLSVSLKLS